MLEGIDHAYAIMDDIIVAGPDIAHHDSVLEKVLYRPYSNDVGWMLRFAELNAF